MLELQLIIVDFVKSNRKKERKKNKIENKKKEHEKSVTS